MHYEVVKIQCNHAPLIVAWKLPLRNISDNLNHYFVNYMIALFYDRVQVYVDSVIVFCLR